MASTASHLTPEHQAQRAKHIGASEVAALFNVSPYISRFTLWHQKAGKVLAPDFDSERMKWGRRLEDAIAQGVADDFGLDIRKVHRYISHKTIAGMGASLDYEVVNHPDGAGCLEIKNVGLDAWRKNWEESDDGNLEAPLSIELQLQHQLAVTGRAWGAIGLLIGGNESRLVVRKRHEPTIQKIEQAVADFWESIRLNVPPDPEAPMDWPIVAAGLDPDSIEVTEDPAWAQLMASWQVADDAAKRADENKKRIKALVVETFGRLGKATIIGGGFKATYKEFSRKAYEVKASTGHRLTISPVKG